MVDYIVVKKISEERIDKNEKVYKVLTFVTPPEKHHYDIEERKTKLFQQPQKVRQHCVWQESYNGGGEEDFGYSLNIGDNVMGSIVSMPVEPYDIVNKETGEVVTVANYTAVVLGDSSKSNWNYLIHKEFEKQDKVIRQLPTLETLLGKNV
jgi:hypothetical protein